MVKETRETIVAQTRTSIEAQMDSLTNTITSTIGILIGYFSSEVASTKAYERLYWPERFYYSVDPWSLIKAALFMPLGGILHKATLKALDEFYGNGIMTRKRARGHMLGTPFFRDTGYKYTKSGTGDQEARNGFLLSVLELCSRGYNKSVEENQQKGAIRAIQTVCILTISFEPDDPRIRGSTPVIGLFRETAAISPRAIVGMVSSEVVAIGLGFWVAIYCRTGFAALWFVPIVIKLLAAIASLQREPLNADSSADGRKPVSLQIEHPTAGFMIIQGPSGVLNRFSGHYGHPIRSKNREMTLIFLMLALNMVYPVGMTCSLWMPSSVQFAWLGYLLYVAVAMHLYRYCGGDASCSTQEAVAKALLRHSHVFLQMQKGVVLGASLKIIPVKHGIEGRAMMHDLAIHDQVPSGERGSSLDSSQLVIPHFCKSKLKSYSKSAGRAITV